MTNSPAVSLILTPSNEVVGGIDEAGRGPLAGPVVAAVVVLSAGQQIDGVRDSKQLSAVRRDALFDVICRESLAWAIGHADVAEIDTLNILHATMLAMRRAVGGLGAVPGRLRFDGNRAPTLPDYDGVTETVVGGDRICPAIAAASILAKVAGQVASRSRMVPFLTASVKRGAKPCSPRVMAAVSTLLTLPAPINMSA